ncbi:MAG TPA: universal stress protein [Gaiellaceae bacterium]|nr:universal stress protein [Gaiellaceae bacterium]
MFQLILIAWDGSRPAERAFDLAVDIARRYDGEVVAASVAHSPAHAETEGDRAESVDAARKYLEETFDRVRDRAERAGVPVEQAIIEGDEPASDILRFAHEQAFDVVVIGHHRNTRPGRFLLHGLAERLIASASVPVLVVSDERESE